jgi:Protein of unknown function (DUF2950)
MIKGTLLAVLLAAVAHAALAQQEFKTPEAAVAALREAVAANDQARLDVLFGPDYGSLRRSQQADPALAELRFQRFAARLREFRSLVPQGGDRYTLVVGADAWPLPIPIVRAGRVWHFDGAAGAEEMRNRIVGANELNAIAVLDAIAIAQREYALDDHDGDGVLEYAMRVISTPGQQDGLYWDIDTDDADAVLPAPLDLLKTVADAVLGEREVGAPFLGYYFRMLYSQGPNAPAGAYEYRINGHMVGGFAMIAWPAQYGETGVMTFMLNQDHVVYERDLGEDTAATVGSIATFDPAEGWTPVDDG